MKASELRIGNLVYGVSDRIETVIGLTENTITAYVGKLSGSKMESSEKDYSPIPLSEKWLLKFGFIQTPLTYDREKLCISISGIQYDNGRTYFNSWAILERQPKYVHELQNLYFSLTGEELMIQQ